MEDGVSLPGGLREDRAAPALGAQPPARPGRMLMLASNFNMPYRILRCAQATGAQVFVLGNPGARPMRHSRFCSGFFLSDCIINGDRDEALALEINCLVRRLGIELVLAGDAPTTRALIAIRDLVETACFPMPSLELFDELNDKWAFAQLCARLGITHPATRRYTDAGALTRALDAGEVELPVVVKPLGRSGSGGVYVIDGASRALVERINYRPVLAQAFVPGLDIGASIYARAGRIESFVAHRWWRQVYVTFTEERVLADLSRLTADRRLDGVYNFDMRLAPDGTVHYLECNPRFFFKINMSMVAGINFVECGIRPPPAADSQEILAGVQVRFPKALAHSLATSGRCGRRDWKMLWQLLGDPVPYCMEQLGMTI